MINLLAQAVSKAKAELEAVSKTTMSAVQLGKTKLDSVVYNGRTKVELLSGKFIGVVEGTVSLVVEGTKTKIAEVSYVGKTAVSLATGLYFLVYSRTLQNIANLTDQINSIVFSKGLEENLPVTDTQKFATTKPLTDSNTVEDQVVKQIEFNRLFDENNLVSEIFNLGSFKNVTEEEQISDIFTRTVQFYRDPQDTVYATDDINGSAVDDDQNIVFFKVVGEGIALQDTPSLSVVYIREFAEEGAVTSFPVLGTGKFVYDNSQTSDIFDRVVQYTRLPDDPVMVSEVLENNYSKTVEPDYFNISDSVSIAFNYYRNFEDQITATDDVNGFAVDDDQNIVFFKNITDQGVIEDTITTEKVFSRQYNDTNNISDIAGLDSTKLLEHFTTTDDTVKLGILKSTLDDSQISDSLNIVSQYYRDAPETVTLQETVKSSTEKPISDNTNLTDDLIISIGFIRDLLDDNQISDIWYLENLKTLSDTNNITDLFERTVTYSKSIADQSDLSDLLYINSSKNITLDQINFSDTISFTTNYTRNLTDDVTATDDVNGSSVDDDQNITFFKVTSDQGQVTDSSTTEFGKRPQDEANISSSGILLMQNYGADYFQQDYVGVSRSIS